MCFCGEHGKKTIYTCIQNTPQLNGQDQNRCKRQQLNEPTATTKVAARSKKQPKVVEDFFLASSMIPVTIHTHIKPKMTT